MDLKTLLQKLTGEQERTAALTAQLATANAEITTLKASATAATPDPAATAKLAADLAAAQKIHADHVATSATVSTALNFTLAALGVENAAIAGKDEAGVKAVIGARIAAKSAEQLAAAGFSAALNDAPNAASADSGDVLAQYEALMKKNPTEAALYFNKNKAAFDAADAASRK